MIIAKRGTPTVTPKLRFPKFREDAQWTITSLGALVESDASTIALNKLALQQAGYPVYGADGLVGHIDTFAQDESYIAIVKDGSGVGRLASLPAKSSVLSTLAYLKSRNNEVASLDWLYHCLSSLDLRKYIKGSGIPHIYYSDYSNEVVGVPPLAEQQKIADCLTSLDLAISAQRRKVEALKAYRRGLMQQLFPCEGETRPRLRFPEFSNALDWVERKLDELAKRGSGHTPSKSNTDHYEGGIKWVSLADSKRLDGGFITDTAVQISAQGIANSSAVLHPAGSVILSRDAGVGKSAIMKEPMAVSQHFMVWECKANVLSNWYLYYLFQVMKPLFEDVASGSTIKTIGMPFFAALKVITPSLAEQHRIADCLLSLDTIITAESNQFAALKTHKQGLMQQLFPLPNGN